MPRTGEFLSWIRAATRAPSLRNAQPWLFELGEGGLTLKLDPSRRMPVADPQNRESLVSLGCALENLAVAARHDGEELEVAPLSSFSLERGLRVRTHRASAASEGLFHAIYDRQTNRRPYDGVPLNRTIIEAIQRVTLEPGVSMRLVTDRRKFGAWADLVQQADREQRASMRFRREMLRWIRFSDKEVANTLDGLSAATLGRQSVPGWLARAMYPVLKDPVRSGRSEHELVMGSSALLLLVTWSDAPPDWLAAGRSLERLLLHLTVLGVQHAYENQPCQVPELRRHLAHLAGLTGLTGERPQVLLRLGFAPPLPRSPRRPLEEVVVAARDTRYEPIPARRPGAPVS